ncbi:MAG TPA: histone deacetylase, partial [Myxococcaceae bacterium]|nr:histone deacetylase [Myxococcaceae bacterium]
MRLLGFFRAPLDVWYHASYRLPISGLDASHGLEPRRADYAAWYLLEQGRLKAHALRSPEPADFDELAWVHDEAYLESLERPEVLARIFGVDPSDVPVDGVMDSVRRACGGTVEAARRALQTRRPALNLLGGFHHAGRARGGGNCPVNDLAVAIAAVRREGFRGKVWVLDLDAHPPDGTADCFAGDPDVRISSLSGSDWGPLPGVDETVVPPGSGDAAYLERLEETLRRRPPADLALVVAGGDVLAHDRFGTLALTLEGVRRRDARVAEVLRGVPSVWLPGGGYRVDAWQVLAGTALVLLGRPRERIRARSDPLRWQFSRIARSIPPS